MVFDRSAITTGRTILDFGLGDLKGSYQNTARFRSKGWLVVAFVAPTDPYSAAAVQTLQGWAQVLPADKVSLLGVASGSREQVEEFVSASKSTFPFVWDYENYAATLWSITAIPTLFLIDASGKVLARVSGAGSEKLAQIKSLLDSQIQEAAEKAAAAEAAKAAAQPAQAVATPEPPAKERKEPRGKKQLVTPKNGKK